MTTILQLVILFLNIGSAIAFAGHPRGSKGWWIHNANGLGAVMTVIAIINSPT